MDPELRRRIERYIDPEKFPEFLQTVPQAQWLPEEDLVKIAFAVCADPQMVAFYNSFTACAQMVFDIQSGHDQFLTTWAQHLALLAAHLDTRKPEAIWKILQNEEMPLDSLQKIARKDKQWVLAHPQLNLAHQEAFAGFEKGEGFEEGDRNLQLEALQAARLAAIIGIITKHGFERRFQTCKTSNTYVWWLRPNKLSFDVIRRGYELVWIMDESQFINPADVIDGKLPINLSPEKVGA